jgi:WS/DGAT/MGAT family acyltransferase
MSEKLKRRLTPMDAAFLYIERPEQPMHVGAVCEFEGKIPFVKFMRNLESRLHLIPRYRQRVVFAPMNLGHPTWEDDADFDIRHHVKRHTVRAPGGELELRKMGEALLTDVLDREKPLWEVHIIEGLAGNKTGIVFKVHHCMVDGVSGIGLAYVLFDMVPDVPKMAKPRFKPAPMPESGKLLQDALRDTAVEGLEHWTRFQRKLIDFGRDIDTSQIRHALKKFGATMGNFLLPFASMPFNVPLSGKRRMHWSAFNFADARAIRAVCGGTVNDVALAVIGGAVRKYLQEGGDSQKLPRHLRVLVPVNVREEHERGQLGNRISFLPVEVPLHLEDPVERLQSVHLYTREMKEAKVASSISLMFDVIMGSPAPIYAAGLGTVSRPRIQSLIGLVSAIPPANMIVTNVPGPQIPLYTVGHRMLAFYPTLPVALEMGVNFSITSYDQRLYITLSGDGQASDAIDQIGVNIERSFHELREAAAVKEAQYVKIVREAEAAAPAPSARPEPAAPAASVAKPRDTPRVKAPAPSKKRAAKTKVKTEAPAPSLNGNGIAHGPVRRKLVVKRKTHAGATPAKKPADKN